VVTALIYEVDAALVPYNARSWNLTYTICIRCYF